MGHYATLYSSVCPEPCGAKEGGHSELYLEAKYCLPIFWLALFRPQDMHMFAGDDLDGEAWPYLLGRRDECLAVLLKRRTNLFSVLPQKHLPVYESFADVLQKLQQPYLHFTSDDIAGLSGSGPSQWKSVLLESLIALDAPPPERIRSGLAAFFRGSGLAAGWDSLLMRNGIELAKPKSDDWYRLAGGNFSEMSWEPRE